MFALYSLVLWPSFTLARIKIRGFIAIFVKCGHLTRRYNKYAGFSH